MLKDPEKMSKTEIMAHVEAMDKLYELRYSSVNRRVEALEERERLTAAAIAEMEKNMKFGFTEVLLAIAAIRLQEKKESAEVL